MDPERWIGMGEGTAIRSGAREVQLRPGPEKKTPASTSLDDKHSSLKRRPELVTELQP